jgi:hypothetical protein
MDSNTASLVAASVAAVAASASALVAVAALYIEGHRTRALLRIELQFKFNDRFSSDSFREIRSSAASALITDAEDFGKVDEVLDFLESMGLMMHRKALDPEMVWSDFSYWIEGWWCAASSYIQEVRADDDTIWMYFRHLREKILDVEKRLTNINDSDLVWSREDITNFLESEQSVTQRKGKSGHATKKRSHEHLGKKSDQKTLL